jgi:hypothetical protein
LANHSLKISTSNRPTSTVSELGGHRCPSASELARLGGFSAAFSTGLGGAEEVNKKNMSSLPHKKNMFFSIFFPIVHWKFPNSIFIRKTHVAAKHSPAMS